MKTKAIVPIAALLLLFAGCGEKKCFFVSQDGKSLAPNAPVVWYDAYVGKVESVEAVANGVKVSFCLNTKYNDEIRDGVAGRVVTDPKISPMAFVLLVGGRDKERSLVENGAQIPESKTVNAVSEGFSAFVDWLKGAKTDELVVVGIVLLVLLVLFKFVTKLIKFVIFLAILCAIGYVCVTVSAGWDKYKEQISNVKETAQEAGAWLQQHGDKLHAVIESALKGK